MGQPIAYIGHKVHCPKCKGDFPIIEGAQTTIFYGQGVALAGMHTSCGAVLIATQFTDIVEIGGKDGGDYHSSTFTKTESANAQAHTSTEAPNVQLGPESFDDKFVLVDDVTDKPYAFTEYAIRRESGEVEFGKTDAQGHTHLLSATANAEVIEVFI